MRVPVEWPDEHLGLVDAVEVPARHSPSGRRFDVLPMDALSVADIGVTAVAALVPPDVIAKRPHEPALAEPIRISPIRRNSETVRTVPIPPPWGA